jgi:hypothetical protein
MTSLETLECRRDVTEGRMFEVAASLGSHLHTIEERVSRLATEIHELVRHSGRMQIDVKKYRIVGEIQAVIAALDLSEALEMASRVAELKAEVTAYEEAIDRETSPPTTLEESEQAAAVVAA